MASWLQRQWLGYTLWHVLLLPVSWLFLALICIRKWLYQANWLKSYRLPVPVIVVGNINVGGTGKTPLVIYLAEQLQAAGYKPGIISRGYGGDVAVVSEVFAHSQPQQMGDEPVLIAKRTHCPIFVGANRVAAASALLRAYPQCSVLISDDGLQHYRLQRDVELVVVDASLGFGNKLVLPAGPLREPISRLQSVDALVSNGKWPNIAPASSQKVPVEMQLESGPAYNLLDSSKQEKASDWLNKRVLAIAGIGNPERFFEWLRGLGLKFEAQPYPDHHQFTSSDCAAMQADVVVMTEKDAVKCQAFARPNFWVLPVNARVAEGLMPHLLAKLRPAK